MTNEVITIPIPETITNQRNYGKKQNIYTLTPKITRRNRENKTPTILANNGIHSIIVISQEAEEAEEATQSKAEITLVFDAINNPTLELTNDITSDAENITEIIQNNPQVFNNKFQSDGTPDITEYMILVQAIYDYVYEYLGTDNEDIIVNPCPECPECPECPDCPECSDGWNTLFNTLLQEEWLGYTSIGPVNNSSDGFLVFCDAEDTNHQNLTTTWTMDGEPITTKIPWDRTEPVQLTITDGNENTVTVDVPVQMLWQSTQFEFDFAGYRFYKEDYINPTNDEAETTE